MTEVEMKQAIEQLKAENHSDEEILGGFFKMFQNDKLTFDELDGITNLMGYHITDKFKALSPEEQKTKGYEMTEVEADKETIEDAKEIKPEEKAEGGEEKPEEKPEEKSEDDSDEEKKAMKLFGLDK